MICLLASLLDTVAPFRNPWIDHGLVDMATALTFHGSTGWRTGQTHID